MRTKNKLLIFVLILGQTLITQANIKTKGEPSAEHIQKKLSSVQDQMKQLEKKLFHGHKEEQQLTSQLAKLEKEIGEQSEQQRQLQSKMIAQQVALEGLEKEENKLNQITQTQQINLSKLLAATFAHQHEEQLKIILNQNDLPHYARINEYYHFFNNARAKQIELLQSDLKKVTQLKKTILQERIVLEDLEQKIKQEQIVLHDKKRQRQEILKSLNKQVATVEDSLQKLHQQEQHLEQLFKSLHKSLETTPTYIEPAHDFAKMKHQLSLPIATADAKLSTLPHLTQAKAKKSYIASSTGTPVHAIFGGRVVFAEWLRGVGLLIIVDHGKGYMSLYGNNQKLYKGIGDYVQQGEMIARVGQSGGHSEPGLYFEIRKDGEALDPSAWFKA